MFQNLFQYVICSIFLFFFSDSPVLWIRVDPDMQLVRSLDILQPDFQWQYQLRHERDITAQVEAVRSLERYPTPGNNVFIF